MKNKQLYTKDFNHYLSEIINAQKTPNQPIYIIASFWCGSFDGIKMFSTEGEKDLEEMEQIFKEKYAWKENQIGITEQTYKIIKLDFSEILDCFGKKIK